METAKIPLTSMNVSAKVVFAVSLGLWLMALVSYIIAWVNYNGTNQKTYNLWQTLGSFFVWIQIFTVLALVGTPNLFTTY